MRAAATLRAASWAFISTAGTRIISLLSLAVLARLLAPTDFGLLAFALVYITYAETIGDLGTAVALIYWPDRRDDAAQVTFVINMAMGLLWCGGTMLLAPLIAEFFNNPEAAPIVRVLALAFLVKYAGNTHDALAQKDLRFRARAIPELGLTATKAAISIALAYAGLGAWSLVWGHLLGLTIWTIGVWLIVPWRPRWSFPSDLVVPMLRYGQGIVGVNIIAAVVHHSDLLVVGRMLGARALGLYQIAYKIPEASVSVILWVASKVLFPAFSKMQHSGEGLRNAYLKALRYVSFVTVPMAVGLFVSAEPLVAVFFGEKWMDSVPLLQWLALYAGLRSLGTHAGDVLKATGRSGLLAGLGLLKAAILLPALIAAGSAGVREVAMAMALVTAVTVAINLVVVRHLLKFRWLELLESLRTSALGGGALLIAGLAVATMVDPLPEAVALATIVLGGAVVYGIVTFALDRALFGELVEALPRRGRRHPESGVAEEAEG